MNKKEYIKQIHRYVKEYENVYILTDIEIYYDFY